MLDVIAAAVTKTRSGTLSKLFSFKESGDICVTEDLGRPYKSDIKLRSVRSASAPASSVATSFFGKIDYLSGLRASYSSQSCSNLRKFFNKVGMNKRTAIIIDIVTAKYMSEPNVVIKARILSTLKVYCSLFERSTITIVPMKTRHMAVTSYLGTNFSPSHFVEMNTFMRTAEEELQAIKVRSQKGRATKCPTEPAMTRNSPQMPFNEQNIFFWIVASADLPDFLRFSSSICATFCIAKLAWFIPVATKSQRKASNEPAAFTISNEFF